MTLAFLSLVESTQLRRFMDLQSTVKRVGNELIDTYPQLTPIVMRVWYLYVAAYVRLTVLCNELFHDARIDPFELLWVDPNSLEQQLSASSTPKFKLVGRVMDGDWDLDTVAFAETDVYEAFEAHFERGVAWEDTPFFARVVEQIEAGEPMWECESRVEFERRCEQLDELYERIRTDGYKTQAELATEQVDDPIDKDRFSRTERFIQDEMSIAVGRDGELLFCDGRDRLAIAKLLDLDAIPVWVTRRHARWQRLRNAVATGDVEKQALPDRLRNHPDLPTDAGANRTR